MLETGLPLQKIRFGLSADMQTSLLLRRNQLVPARADSRVAATAMLAL